MNQGSLISLTHLKLLEKEEKSQVSSHYMLFLHLSDMSQLVGRLSENRPLRKGSHLLSINHSGVTEFKGSVLIYTSHRYDSTHTSPCQTSFESLRSCHDATTVFSRQHKRNRHQDIGHRKAMTENNYGTYATHILPSDTKKRRAISMYKCIREANEDGCCCQWCDCAKKKPQTHKFGRCKVNEKK